MARLLLVESDRYLRRTLQRLFAAEGYDCAVAADGEETRRAMLGEPFDLVVLDVGGIPATGLNLLRFIRTQYHTPILLLAPHHDVVDTVAGLDGGADDYLCEPFDPRELLARVRAQLRRAGEYSQPVAGEERIELGDLVLDVDRRDVLRDGRPLHLTPREFELLHLFARHRDKALASEWLYEHVWGAGADLGRKALTVYVGRLRRKIEADPRHPQLLLSVRGFGYKLVTTRE